MILLESGGDNLAANFSPELSDFTIYVIDVAGGDKVRRKQASSENQLSYMSNCDSSCLFFLGGEWFLTGSVSFSGSYRLYPCSVRSPAREVPV